MAQMVANPSAIRRYQIMAHATEALDGQENALEWLQKPSAHMGGRTPLQVLDAADPVDLERLEDILNALDYGMHL